MSNNTHTDTGNTASRAAAHKVLQSGKMSLAKDRTTQPNMGLARFDFDRDTRDLFNKAVDLSIIDAVELGILMSRWGKDASEIVNEISGYAEAQRNEPLGSFKAGAWGRAADTWRDVQHGLKMMAEDDGAEYEPDGWADNIDGWR